MQVLSPLRLGWSDAKEAQGRVRPRFPCPAAGAGSTLERRRLSLDLAARRRKPRRKIRRNTFRRGRRQRRLRGRSARGHRRGCRVGVGWRGSKPGLLERERDKSYRCDDERHFERRAKATPGRSQILPLEHDWLLWFVFTASDPTSPPTGPAAVDLARDMLTVGCGARRL